MKSFIRFTTRLILPVASKDAMKKLFLTVCCLIVFAGCRGKDGPQGLPGPAGLNSSVPVTLTGTATASGTVVVTVPNLNLERGDVLTIYFCSGSDCQAVPFVNGSSAVRYTVNGTTITITYSADMNGETYQINALEKTS